MTNDKALGMNTSMLLTGVNTLAIVAVLTYAIRNISDLNAYVEELAHELKSVKASHSDTTKRMHSAISKLGELQGSKTQPKSEAKIQEVDEFEINTRVDEVSAAIDELLSN